MTPENGRAAAKAIIKGAATAVLIKIARVGYLCAECGAFFRRL